MHSVDGISKLLQGFQTSLGSCERRVWTAGRQNLGQANTSCRRIGNHRTPAAVKVDIVYTPTINDEGGGAIRGVESPIKIECGERGESGAG